MKMTSEWNSSFKVTLIRKLTSLSVSGSLNLTPSTRSGLTRIRYWRFTGRQIRRSTWTSASINFTTSPPFLCRKTGFWGAKPLYLWGFPLKFLRKWKWPHPHVVGYLKALISFSLVRSTHHCIHRSRVPWMKSNCHYPQWEYRAGLVLLLW